MKLPINTIRITAVALLLTSVHVGGAQAAVGGPIIGYKPPVVTCTNVRVGFFIKKVCTTTLGNGYTS